MLTIQVKLFLTYILLLVISNVPQADNILWSSKPTPGKVFTSLTPAASFF
jgi:hypothetical protein